MRRRSIATVAVALVTLAVSAMAQTPGEQPPDRLAAAVAAAAAEAKVSDPPATLTFANRRIVELRATVRSRPPAARVAVAEQLINSIAEQTPDAAVTIGTTPEAVVLRVADRPAVVIFAADVDLLSGETLAGNANDAAARLTHALREASELRRPREVAWAVAASLVLTAVYALLMWLLIRMDVHVSSTLSNATERGLSRLPGGEVMVFVRAPRLVSWLLTVIGVSVGLLLTYSWITAVFRRFPYTRPWGESLRTVLFSAIGSVFRGIVDHIPGLVMILVIVVLTRFAVRMVSFAFDAIEEGRLTVRGIYPETAQPTRRLVVALIWLFALVVSYQYIPGSDSDVFKGVSVFVGVIVSLGSSGIMNQVMSGTMLTYSRAVRLGDFVRIGDVEGTVTQLGGLSTKIKNGRNEEITIPNSVVVSQAATNFSRHQDTDGVFVPTTVTIGYDTPWRQIEALLLLAADRTAGVRKQPQPKVLQTALGDFYVHYTLLICIEQPTRRIATLAALHANIQDAFNEYGVQIMSPNYEADPEGRKIVPRSDWYAAPAKPEALKSGAVAEMGN